MRTVGRSALAFLPQLNAAGAAGRLKVKKAEAFPGGHLKGKLTITGLAI
jgi:hypothetical protein